ncbi:DUF4395 domain-containing protein [Nanoarchaeota archaeon]
MSFGEKVKGYEVPVFNEREVRAAAGILLLLAMIVFFNALLASNFKPLKLFIIFFLIDFTIRLINPRYSPSMTLGRLAVIKQKPEYSGAPQKKFAWALGLIMASTMFILVVILNIKGLINFAMCIACLTFLFFEAAFGICIGCKFYNLFKKDQAKLCPGGACEIRRKEKCQEVSAFQILLTSIVILGILYTSFFI